MILKCQFCPSELTIEPSADFHQQLSSSLWAQIDLDLFACGQCAKQVLIPLSSDPSQMIDADEAAEIANSRLEYMERFYGASYGKK